MNRFPLRVSFRIRILISLRHANICIDFQDLLVTEFIFSWVLTYGNALFLFASSLQFNNCFCAHTQI